MLLIFVQRTSAMTFFLILSIQKSEVYAYNKIKSSVIFNIYVFDLRRGFPES